MGNEHLDAVSLLKRTLKPLGRLFNPTNEIINHFNNLNRKLNRRKHIQITHLLLSVCIQIKIANEQELLKVVNT